MVYNFLGKDENHGVICTYFLLKHHCGKEVRHFSIQCIQAKNHVATAHPFLKLILKKISRRQKRHEKSPSMQRINAIYSCFHSVSH